MKVINEQELLREIRVNLFNVGGLYDYIKFLLSDCDLRDFCIQENTDRTILQSGKNNAWRLNRWLKFNSLGFRGNTPHAKITDGDIAEAYYISDNAIYDTGSPISLAEISRYWNYEFPFKPELAYDVISTGKNPLDLVKEYDYSYEAAWAIWETIVDWAKYDLHGTYVAKTKHKDTRVADAHQLLSWALRHGFPMPMIERFNDIFINNGSILPEDTIYLYQLDTIMHNECLIYRGKNDMYVHMGDRYRSFYYDTPIRE